jgi:hypothetical protein
MLADDRSSTVALGLGRAGTARSGPGYRVSGPEIGLEASLSLSGITISMHQWSNNSARVLRNVKGRREAAFLFAR